MYICIHASGNNTDCTCVTNKKFSFFPTYYFIFVLCILDNFRRSLDSNKVVSCIFGPPSEIH